MALAGPPLASRFRSACRHAAAAACDDEQLEAALLDVVSRGRAAWPGVDVEPGRLTAYLGERAPEDAAPLAWLGALRPGDLHLACACAEGLPEAFRAFHAALLDRMDLHLRALRPSPDLVAETRQVLLEKLFVGAPGKPPKILQYAGQGTLEGWVRVAAVRTALNLLDAERAGRPHGDDDAVARALAPDSDPEIALLRERYTDDFMAAFRGAMASLSRRDRGLLRFVFVERLTPARIGIMYGVHRTTAMRWIEAAEEEVLAGTRSRMMERHRLSPSECDHLCALVKSRMLISITSLLQTAPAPPAGQVPATGDDPDPG